MPAPLHAAAKFEVNWDLFAVACIGHKAEDQLPWHRVTLAVRDSMQLCIERLLERGYKRIGLAIPERIGHYGTIPIESIFTYYALRHPDRFVREELLYHRYDGPYESEIRTWIQRNQPDVVICLDNALMQICNDMGMQVPEDIGLAHVHLAEDVADWAGVDPFEKRQASAAIDLVTAALQRNERGVPPYPKMVQIFGEWVDGRTIKKAGSPVGNPA